jgi:hypothetical protein
MQNQTPLALLSKILIRWRNGHGPSTLAVALITLVTLVGTTLPFIARAGTFTSDFTQGVDTNYWGVWTQNAPADGYTNFIDAQGVTFQRFADPASDATPRASGGVTLGQAAMGKITTNGGLLIGDFAVTMAYTNLNHLVSSTYSFWVQGVNRMKLRLFWGDAFPERVHVVQAFSTSRDYYGAFYKTAFQGCFFDSATPWLDGERLDYNPAVSGSAGTLKLARTNGVLSFYVNDQQIGVGEGGATSVSTTNAIWGVELMLGQEWETAHLGVTFQSCTISGPSVKDNTSVPTIVLTLSSSGSSGIAFNWDSTLGQTYRVQSTTNLVNPDWQTVGDPIIATNTSTSVSYSVGSDLQRFYHVISP